MLSLRVKFWSNNTAIQYRRCSRIFSEPSSPKPPYSDRYGGIVGGPIFTHFGLGQTLNFSRDEPNLGSCHKKNSTSGSVKFV